MPSCLPRRTGGDEIPGGAVSAFSPVSSLPSNGLRMRVCACLCIVRNELIVIRGYASVVYTLSSFYPHTRTHACTHTHTHTKREGEGGREFCYCVQPEMCCWNQFPITHTRVHTHALWHTRAHTHTHYDTHILIPFEDRKLTGLKVDIAPGGGGRRKHVHHYMALHCNHHHFSALRIRWAAMTTIIMLHQLWGTKSQDSVHKPWPVKRKGSWGRKSVWRHVHTSIAP